MIIINPGTEKQVNTTEANAIKSAKRFAKDLNIDGLKLERVSKNDDDNGWYGFKLKYGNKSCTLDIPGVKTDVFIEGKPFYSPRCYVNGSSWLYGFGLSIAHGELIE